MKNTLSISSFSIIVAGLLLVGSGVWGIVFTYKSVALENITTPDDAYVPNVLVRGPFTLKAQADIIRAHTLRMTGGKTFAEMPRQIPKLDESGEQILDNDGKPVMIENAARDIWITATTLVTALNLGIVAYAFAGLAVLLGFAFIWIGVVFLFLLRRNIGTATADAR